MKAESGGTEPQAEDDCYHMEPRERQERVLPESLQKAHDSADTWHSDSMPLKLERISLVFSYPVCGNLLRKFLETNTVYLIKLSQIKFYFCFLERCINLM